MLYHRDEPEVIKNITFIKPKGNKVGIESLK